MQRSSKVLNFFFQHIISVRKKVRDVRSITNVILIYERQHITLHKHFTRLIGLVLNKL